MTAYARKESPRHGVPRRGYVLSTVVEEIAGPIRKVVSELHKAFSKSSRHVMPFPGVFGDDQFERAAWLSLSAWLVVRTSKRFERQLALSDSISWFIGRELTDNERDFWYGFDARHQSALDIVSNKSGLQALLPYILESSGPGSRSSVRRDPSTRKARTSKKSAGIFYTPVDVATFMACEAIKNTRQEDTIKVLDPAVGTGVFLRVALAQLKARNPSENGFLISCRSLFGCDIDPIALDGSASVLLADTLDDALSVMHSPLAAWKALRCGLKHTDALLIDRGIGPSDHNNRILSGDLFPGCANGFDVILGNPPYAAIGARPDLPELAARFETIAAKPRSTANLYPVFIEQMIHLAARSASGAMVVPLSLACNTGAQFSACRSLVERQPGSWRFAFFDRQPHALFGEDVKTRNTILFWRRDRPATYIYTGPLRKWRGDDRSTMLRRIDFTSIRSGIGAAIPKLHGRGQAEVWERMQIEKVRLGHLVSTWGRITLDRVPQSSQKELFVSPTAYNFLGVSRPCPMEPDNGEVLSTHPLLRLSGETEEDAAVVFAILSSRFAFWWWSVISDGFHVSRRILSHMPIGRPALAGSSHKQLAALGHSFWEQVQQHPVRSLNRGRVSYTYSAANADALRSEVDDILLKSLELRASFSDELQQFTNCIAEAILLPPAKKQPERD